MANILEVIISGQANKLINAIDQSENKLKKFSGRLKSIGKDLSLRVTAPLAIAGGAAIKLASDFEESLNKVDVAFGETSKEVRDFSKITLESFGIASGTALDMAAMFGDMSTSMGLNRQTAADLSTSMVGLAGDLASFKNINIEEVTTALAGVFTGETESLKRLGVVMTETNLKQFALSQGITKNIKDFTQAEKTLLRYQFVMDATSNAHGDFARTGEGAANQTRKFTEGLKEIGVQLGNILLPTFTKIVTKANSMLKAFSGLSDSTKQLVVVFGLVAAAIPPLLFLGGSVLPSIAAGLRLISVAAAANPFGAILTAAVALSASLLEVLHQLDPIVSRFQTFVNIVKSGGSPTKFMALQSLSAAKATKVLAEAADTCQISTESATGQIIDLNHELKKLTSNSGDASVPIREVAKSVNTLTTSGAIKSAEGLKETFVKISHTVKQTSEATQEFALMTGDVLNDSFQAILSGASAFDVITQKVKQLVVKLLAAAAAAAIISTLFPGVFGKGGFKVAFAALGGFPAFADGGIVSAPTLGLMGEYSGVKSNPEVIAPLNKLKGMIGNRDTNVNVTGGFRLEGQDLIMALQRAERNRTRL
jgi:hypothetical protein